MQSLFGIELSMGMRWLLAFAVILVLLVLLGVFVRKISGGGLRARGQGGNRARQPRLGVVDVHDLDRQRKLVLIRRDNVEHLIMIGGASDVLVESAIVRGAAARPAQVPVDYGHAERPVAAESFAPVETGEETLPPPPRRPSGPAVAPPPPFVPVPVSPAPAAFEPAPVAEEPPPVSPSRAPQPPAPPAALARASAPAASPGELDDMAKQLEAALKRPFSSVRPSRSGEVETATPAVPMKPVIPIPEPVVDLPPIPVRSAPPIPPLPIPPVAPAPVAPPVSKPIAIPADVEAELEAALGLKPPAAKAPAAPVPPPSAPRVEDAVSAAAIAAVGAGLAAAITAPGVKTAVAERQPQPEPEIVADPVPAETGAEVEDAEALLFADGADEPGSEKPVPGDEPEADDTAAMEPADQPAEPETAAAAADEAEPAKPDAALAEIDPFSVDAIEAEFARLLGRDPQKS